MEPEEMHPFTELTFYFTRQPIGDNSALINFLPINKSSSFFLKESPVNREYKVIFDGL